MPLTKQKFILIDGNALVHRAFHALPPLTTKSGELVNAVYGFITIFLKALKEMDYKGHLTFEILPASADPFGVLRKGGGLEFFDPYTKQSIDYMKKIEKMI